MRFAALAVKSFRNRKFTAGLAVVSIALSVALLLAVETARDEARSSFTSTVSGTDLIVGARSGPVHLLLYSVFRIGNPTRNIEWSSYVEIGQLPEVAWSVPLMMGDSHRGFPVIGTDAGFFEYYRYARNRRLALVRGQWFDHDDEAVIGAEVAASLGYRPGDELVVSHGAGDESFVHHDDKPFRVVGVLERTGTPVDRTVIVDLAGFERMHEYWIGAGARAAHAAHDPLRRDPGDRDHADRGQTDRDHAAEDQAAKDHAAEDHAGEAEPADRQLSAFLLGLESRAAALGLQRAINDYDGEPLSAILPGVTLLELWEIVGLVEQTLLLISAFVVAAGLSSMLIILMASMHERRREMAILRSVGARPWQVLALILGEAAAIVVAGLAAGAALVHALLMLGRDWLAREFGLFVGLDWFSPDRLYILLLVFVCGVLIGLIPGVQAYRYSLLDGMTVRT